MRRGFSLIELAIVMVFAGLIAGLALHIRQSGAGVEGDCRATTKIQMTDIQAAMDRYVKSNNRYPLPAKRALGVENPDFGREVAATNASATNPATDLNSDVGNTVYYGALPFQTLGLAPSYAGDCWGNKFTYVVTKILTTTTATTFANASNVGALVVQNQTANPVISDAAYAIISHGGDGYGASKLNSTSAGFCTLSAGVLQTENCDYGNAIVMLAPFNDGKDAGNAFFDDLIVFATKSGIIGGTTPPNGYGIGQNNDCQLAIAPCTNPMLPLTGTLPPDPVGSSVLFVDIVGGNMHSCGLTSTGAAYCWGQNGDGQLGDGSTSATPTASPTAVVGGLTFNKLALGYTHTCGIATTGTVYCWGANGHGQLGDGTTTMRTSPTAIAPAMTFTDISSFNNHTCAIGTDTKTYCWGDGETGQIGNATANWLGNMADWPTPVVLQPTHTAQVFTQIAVGGKMNYGHTCAINAAGIPYCWGYNMYGQLGVTTTATPPAYPTDYRATPDLSSKVVDKLASLPTADGNSLLKIVAGSKFTCGLTTGGKVICWGDGYGPGNNGEPELIGGSERYVNITAGESHACGIRDTGEVRCWGANGYGQLGVANLMVPASAPEIMPGTGTTIIAHNVAAGWNTTFLIVTQPTQLPPSPLRAIPDCTAGKCGYPSAGTDVTCLTPCAEGASGVNECIAVPSNTSTGGFACNTLASAVQACTPNAASCSAWSAACEPAFSSTHEPTCVGGGGDAQWQSWGISMTLCAGEMRGRWRCCTPAAPPANNQCPAFINTAPPPVVNGACGTTSNTCTSTPAPTGFVAGTCGGNDTWTCPGSGGGTNAPCSMAAPASACDCPSQALNDGEGNLTGGPGCTLTSCCSGSIFVTNPAICPAVGYTNGAGSCAPPPVVNGMCDATTAFACTQGASINNVAGTCGGNDTWTCQGSGGGSDANCSMAAPASTCDCTDTCGNSHSNTTQWCDYDGGGTYYIFRCVAGVATADHWSPACVAGQECM